MIRLATKYNKSSYLNNMNALVLNYNFINSLFLNNIKYSRIRNKFYSTKTDINEPIMSLHEIVEYKNNIIKNKVYQDLFKDKSFFQFGSGKMYPTPSEYGLFENIFDWKSRIGDIIKNDLEPGYIYDIAVLGRDIINEEYITYGNHFLINSQSDISAVITKIEGNIFVNSLSINSGEIGVAENNKDLNSGMRLIIFLIRSVSFNLELSDIVNNKLKKDREIKKNYFLKNKELLKLKNTKLIAMFNSLPNSNLVKDFGLLINSNHIDKSGIIGSLYLYKNFQILIHNTDIKKCEGLQGIVYKNDNEYFKFTDIIIVGKFNEFLRSIDNTTIKYVNNNVTYIESITKSKRVDSLKIDIVRDKKFGSFDIETALDKNNQFIPVSCGWKTDKKYKDYIITNYDSIDHMFKICFEDMFKFNNYTWYAHNLGGFDSVFILKVLFENYGKPKIQFKDGKPLSIKVKYNNKMIVFKDSFKILPLSIRSLIKSYNIKTNKLYFPYSYLRIDNLFYKGILPEKSFFENIPDLEYQKMKNEFSNKKWVMKDELLKYMKNDIVSLYQILDIFSQEMYNLENINITSVSTLSSITLKTYLSNYYNKNKTPIHIPRYNNYLNIKNAYYGGRVEVFKGYVENIYIYDVVSLYPYCMLKELPIGNIITSTDTDLNNYFGFCYASVFVPKNIKAPILPYRLEDGSLLYPTGSWTGWYSSEILKNARDNQNVEVIVHYGYKMKKSEELFNNFVKKYSKIKIIAEKEGNNAKRTIAKLVLNSLYGRFGLKYEPYIIDFVKSDIADKISISHDVLDRIYISNNIECIKYIKAPSDILKEFNRDEYNRLKNKTDLNGENVVRNVCISALITSYASILMNPFLNLSDNPCYYTDTDSLFLKYKLDDKYVGNELGKFSFKGIASRAYFISPKTYCLIMEDGSVIIKCKGLDNKLLTEKDFKEFLAGNSVTFDSKKIFTSLTRGSGGIKEMKLKISPDINNRKTINKNKLNFDTEPHHIINGLIQ